MARPRRRNSSVPLSSEGRKPIPETACEGRRSPPLARKQLRQEVRRRCRQETRRHRHAAVKQVAEGNPSSGGFSPPSWVSASPSRVVGPVSSVIPKMPTFVDGADTNTPFLPINAVVKFRSIWVIGISSQQMNSVDVDTWFSLPIWLPKPPKKSRSTKTGLFGRFDFTSKVSKVRSPWAGSRQPYRYT